MLPDKILRSYQWAITDSTELSVHAVSYEVNGNYWRKGKSILEEVLININLGLLYSSETCSLHLFGSLCSFLSMNKRCCLCVRACFCMWEPRRHNSLLSPCVAVVPTSTFPLHCAWVVSWGCTEIIDANAVLWCQVAEKWRGQKKLDQIWKNGMLDLFVFCVYVCVCVCF